MKSIKDLAKEALDVQDACNLSGVVHSFSRCMTDLREALRVEMGDSFSTHALNTHPIAVAYSSKIASLTDSESCQTVSHAFRALNDMVQS